jgi:hypothetical protein
MSECKTGTEIEENLITQVIFSTWTWEVFDIFRSYMQEIFNLVVLFVFRHKFI